jgi:hypothetical protein
MITTIRRLGNSRGIIIPKPMLKEAGLDEEAEPQPPPRLGGSQPHIGGNRG